MSSQIFATFKMPDGLGEPVKVYRYLPDNSKEQIGIIHQSFSEDGTATYTCLDRNGKLLFTPTNDYNDAEVRFEQYAKQLSTKQLVEERDKQTEEYKKRINEIKLARSRREPARDLDRF